ncbi:MAG: ParA family protein [Thermonemataceae bacterium]
MTPIIIAVVNQKGGTGKTTTTVNLGKALCELGKKVLLIDLDPQGSLSYYLGANSNVWSIADVILGDVSFQNTVIEREGLHMIPADLTLADLELSLVNYTGRETILKKLLEKHVQSYDFVLLDCSPSLSVLTINALVASSQLVIPLQLEVLSMHGLELILETVEQIKKAFNPTLEILGILLLMYDRRKRITQEVLAHIIKTYDFINIFNTLIRTDVKLVEAPSFGQTIFSYAPTSHGAEDYRNMAKEVLHYTEQVAESTPES